MNKKKILIFGSTSFFLKYFINKYKKKIDFYFVDRYIKNKKHFKFTADKKKLYIIISKVNPDVIIYSSSVKDSKHNNNLKIQDEWQKLQMKGGDMKCVDRRRQEIEFSIG